MRKTLPFYTAGILTVFWWSFATLSLAQILSKKQQREPQSQHAPTGTPRYTLLNINNISSWMRSDGQSNHSPTGDNGARFPRGTSWVIYQDGIMWGGKAYIDAARTQPAPFNQLIRVGGANYSVGTREGRVIGFGASALPADPTALDARLYRIRRDYFTISVDDLRRDAAEINEIGLSQVTEAQMQTVRDQYNLDWREWPVQYGAPFIDRNHNGVYDPPPAFSPTFTVDDLIRGGHDEPGIAGANPSLPADQVVWTAFNDLESNTTVSFYGSLPLGLEVQATLWAYKNNSTLANVFFRRVRFINKGGVEIDAVGNKGAFWIDSLYAGQWADPDVGDFSDDLTGCIPELNAGFVYNASPVDVEFRKFSLPPPAIGYDLVQGPIIPSPGATAIFDLKKINGFQNLGMTAFAYFAAGAPWGEPSGGNYSAGTLRWYRVLRGFAPFGLDQHYPFPPGMTPNAFPLSGDPVTDFGFLDGQGTSYSFGPGDRRMMMPSGPFRLAPGDTQEVVLACVGGLGSDRLASIAAMRSNLRTVQALYDRLFAISAPPELSAQVSYPAVNLAEIKLTASGKTVNATVMVAVLKQPDGTPVTEAVLFDDGAHGDEAANDGVFGNTVDITRKPIGLYADVHVTDNLQMTQIFERVLDNLTTAGPVQLDAPEIFSDNLNHDNKANPGENVRYGFRVSNQTTFSLSNLRLSPVVEFEIGKTITIASIGARQDTSFSYDPKEPQSYFSFQTPLHFTDPQLQIAFEITDNQNNRWLDTLVFAIVPMPGLFTETPLKRIAGKGDGDFFLRIVDRAALKNHEYMIMGVDSINVDREPGFILKDNTENRILLSNSPLPDTLGHNMPVIDGFIILRGTIPDQRIAGMVNWTIPSGIRTWTWSNAEGLGFEGFNGAMGWQEPAAYFGVVANKTLKPSDLKNTLIKFAETDVSGDVLDPNDPDWSFAHRYLRGATASPAKPEFAPFIKNPTPGYAYQDYLKSAPFSAWDVETNPPRRLMIGFLENNTVNGLVDGKYWPPDNTVINNVTGPREWFFIFDVTYSETPDARMTKDILNNPMPVLWWGTPARRGNTVFHAEDEFLIQASHVITSQDVWVFNPTLLVGLADEGGQPYTFELAQNYPNPFNPSTQIIFSIPAFTKVTLKIYNMLGQEVATLVDEKLAAGKHIRIWGGADQRNRPVASGVYFYQLKAGELQATKKLLLLR